MRHHTVVDYEREALKEHHLACLEGGQAHRLGKRQLFVREQRKWQVKALRGLALIVGILGRKAKQVLSTLSFQLREMVAE